VSPLVIATVLGAGALGALARYCVSLAVARRARHGVAPFPWAVLIVNVVGSAIGGALLGLAQAGAVSGELRLVLLTGFCGGLTTFSTLGVETVQLVIDGRARAATLSVAANLAAGLAAAAAGWAIVVLALP
jgi:CrcB protein